MSNAITVIGMQWGDEGKGKVVDYLSKKTSVVARFNGGNNAGHTLVVNDQKIVLHLLPSGMLHEGKIGVIGNGVVIDPKVLLDEMKALRATGREIAPKHLLISGKAHVILPPHIESDKRTGGKIGTTARGIGPAYASKAARKGLRMHDFVDPVRFKARFGAMSFYQEYAKYAKALAPYVTDTSIALTYAAKKGKKMLFEGAQATMLDIDHGTYPYVTSSNCTSGAVVTGLGIAPQLVGTVLGICKAYTTRVGNGPFVSELNDETGAKIAAQGHEFGATTGRARRVGWFDAVIARYAVRINGISHVALTKLDVFNGLDVIKVCTHYMLNGEKISELPSDSYLLSQCTPVYQEFRGWWDDISKIKSFDELPGNARAYLRALEKMIGAQISLIGVGPDRKQIIVRSDIV